MAKAAGLAGSVILSLLLCCLCIGALQYYTEWFASSRGKQIAGGVIAGFFYFFLLIFLSSTADAFSKNRFSVGWISVMLAVAAAEWAASTVDTSCCLPCGVTCAVLTWYLSYCSELLNNKRV
uniref:Uncharacterized protein n=2 Tax=Hemiselmis andersenii TaxID=464988 RepID=A0A6U5C167_HEMAN|mmetsp:Transcript_21214/g.49150  ORF Transcript_21214/g.49150 Transcript_21214/m.49150 type:complete len:122 (+) Transcript_21214:29-394(+)